MTKIHLGAPDPNWLAMADRPLCVSHTRLRRYSSISSLPICDPCGEWILDAGTYDLITRHGRHLDTPEEYVLAVRRYARWIRNMAWAAPQDFCCETTALRRTGGTVFDHIELSVQSYLDVTEWWERLAPQDPCPFRPAMQGHEPEDYLRCWDLFQARGVDFSQVELIAVGSVCGRERTDDIHEIVEALRERYDGEIHGFGVKADAIGLFDRVDTQGWSFAARKQKIKHPACTQNHRSCQNCYEYAAHWHDQLIARHAA